MGAHKIKHNVRAATLSPAGFKVRKSEATESDREEQTAKAGKQDFQKGVKWQT